VFVRCFSESSENLHVLFKFIGEFSMFLISPAGAECGQLVSQSLRPVAELGVEFVKIAGELPQLFWVHDGLRH